MTNIRSVNMRDIAGRGIPSESFTVSQSSRPSYDISQWQAVQRIEKILRAEEFEVSTSSPSKSYFQVENTIV